VLHCALDPFWVPPEAPPPRPSAARILTVARLSASERYKGVDHLIQALPQVRNAHPEVRCRIVGDGSDRQRLVALAQELGVSTCVSFLGAIGGEALGREYADADLFVMPSTQEGFGIVFLEAASYRKPSIGAAAGGAPEVIRDGVTGALVPPANPDALAAAICRLLGAPDQLGVLGQAAFQELQDRFSFPVFRTRFSDLMTSPGGAGRPA
jgi:phosphatidylinositol alpha-1,6-mannosyltransferase